MQMHTRMHIHACIQQKHNWWALGLLSIIGSVDLMITWRARWDDSSLRFNDTITVCSLINLLHQHRFYSLHFVNDLASGQCRFLLHLFISSFFLHSFITFGFFFGFSIISNEIWRNRQISRDKNSGAIPPMNSRLDEFEWQVHCPV